MLRLSCLLGNLSKRGDCKAGGYGLFVLPEIDLDKCIGCRLCERVCIGGAITIDCE